MFLPRSPILLFLLLCILTGATNAAAEVVNATPEGFSLKISVGMAAAAPKVFDTIVNSVGMWWSSAHTFSGSARNLTIEAAPGGCFCEKWGSGAGVRHMTVIYVDPGKTLRLRGGLGPMQSMGVSGSMTFALAEKGGTTSLVLTYNVGGYTPEGLTKWAPAADAMLSEQIARLKGYIETGNAETK